MSDERDQQDDVDRESTADELGDAEAEREAKGADGRARGWLPEAEPTDGPAPAP